MKRKASTRVDTTNLDLLAEQEFTIPQIAEATGVGLSTLYEARRSKKMPKAASIACEALLRRNSKTATCLALVRVPCGKLTTLREIVVGALNGTITEIEETSA